MFEVAHNNTGLLEGRKPYATEAEARAVAQSLANERGEAFQLWDQTRLLNVVTPAERKEATMPEIISKGCAVLMSEVEIEELRATVGV